MDLHIRPATATDIPAIQAVGAAAWRDTYPGLVPDGYLDDGLARAWAREVFEQALTNPHVRLLVAELNGTVVGMAQLGWNDEGIAGLWRLYLRRDQRGQGLGRRMWEAIIADLPAHIRTVRTSVVRGNPALHFYQRLGFGITHEGNPEYAGYRVPLIFLERPVDGANLLPPTDPALVTMDYAANELDYNHFMEPAYRSALARLALPDGSRGLDLGCGPGGLLPLLAAQVGPQGRVVGVDVSQPHLEVARRLVEQHGLTAQVRLEWADLARPLPYADAVFDWVWCADALWPGGSFDPIAVLREAVRVVRPGGVVAIWFIAFQRGIFLPGEAELELALHQAVSRTYYPSAPTDLHPEQAISWLRAAGLQELMLSAHPMLVRAPLDAPARNYLEGFVLAQMRQLPADALDTLSAETRDRWQRLSDPAAPEYLFDQPDYYCMQVGLLASGIRAVSALEERTHAE